jgi:hypothetical protein
MDDYLELRNLTQDRVPQVLFHSGYRGASDGETFEHILAYDKSKAAFADVAPELFYNSGTHGLRWLDLQGRTIRRDRGSKLAPYTSPGGPMSLLFQPFPMRRVPVE